MPATNGGLGTCSMSSLMASVSPSARAGTTTANTQRAAVTIGAGTRMLEEPPQRAQVEVELVGREAEARGHVAHGLLQPHERHADVLRLLRRQRAALHAPDGLALQELADELHERQHEPRDRLLHVLRVGVPARGERVGLPLELGTQRLELAHLDERPPRTAHAASSLKAYGSHGPVTLTRHGRSPVRQASTTSR